MSEAPLNGAEARGAGMPQRRASDQRSGERRRAGGRRRDDALFPSTLDADSQASGFADPGWLSAGDIAADDQRLLRQVRRYAASPESALARVFRTYTAARAAVGVGLVLAQGLGAALGLKTVDGAATVSLAYAVQALVFWLLPRYRSLSLPQPPGRQRRKQWLATIGIDLLAFSALHIIAVGTSFNYAALLVLPVLMGGVLTSRMLALGTAAAVALMLLLVALSAGALAGLPEVMLQAGLAGLGLFIITLMSGEMAARLAREELAARGSLELARQQAQLNRLVIEEMVDGVLVVDRKLRVRAANPAARGLIVAEGLSPPAPFGLGDEAAWAPLSTAVAQAFAQGQWPEAGREVTLRFRAGHSCTLRARVKFMHRPRLDGNDSAGPASVFSATSARPEASETAWTQEPFLVLLLEDVRTALERVRQEKLAAMGRVSAGVAHEIRNPLAAIAQANALMLEDAQDPAQQRLARIVADNVLRLKRLMDDVSEVAPGAQANLDAVIDACATVHGSLRDWAATNAVSWGPAVGVDPGKAQGVIIDNAAGVNANNAAGVSTNNAAGVGASATRVLVDLSEGPLPVHFDAEHLRRVLVNLLDNAHRHAQAGAAAVAVALRPRSEHELVLSVRSQGQAIEPDKQRLLFEPFYSTRSRGTGLGLYICRELCERYGALIDYRSLPASEPLRNEFYVVLRRYSGLKASAAQVSHLQGQEATSIRTHSMPGPKPDSTPVVPAA